MKEKEINTGNSCNKEDWSKLDANKTMLNHGDGLEVRSFASNLPEEMGLMQFWKENLVTNNKNIKSN